mmetsp:Transcript_72078/g.204612  ORF Transcript_72078/g.204612 Transcript_72078/m.204612 type:complete len:298 (+) Transcript_72078:1098-1991(+)
MPSSVFTLPFSSATVVAGTLNQQSAASKIDISRKPRMNSSKRLRLDAAMSRMPCSWLCGATWPPCTAESIPESSMPRSCSPSPELIRPRPWLEPPMLSSSPPTSCRCMLAPPCMVLSRELSSDLSSGFSGPPRPRAPLGSPFPPCCWRGGEWPRFRPLRGCFAAGSIPSTSSVRNVSPSIDCSSRSERSARFSRSLMVQLTSRPLAAWAPPFAQPPAGTRRAQPGTSCSPVVRLELHDRSEDTECIESSMRRSRGSDDVRAMAGGPPRTMSPSARPEGILPFVGSIGPPALALPLAL